MDTWIVISATLVLGAVGYLLVRHLRIRRQLKDAMQLMGALRSEAYRMGCALYGQKAVDRAMRQAKERGEN